MGRAGSVILHQAVPRTRVGKAGIVMPRTLPTTFKGESDEDVQERPVGAAAPGRDGEERARRGDEPPRGGHGVRRHGQDGPQVPGTSGISAPPAARTAHRGPAGRAGPRRGHVAERIVSLRHHRLTGTRIAAATGVSLATAVRVLKYAGLSRLKDLEPEEPARRCQHDRPGGMARAGVKRPVRFDRPGHRVTGARAKGPAGSARASVWTTPRASPATACSPTRSGRVPSSSA